MRLSKYDPEVLVRNLLGGGILLKIGPFSVRVATDLPVFARQFISSYADFPLLDAGDFFDFDVAVVRAEGIFGSNRRRVCFLTDGRRSSSELPVEQVSPTFEWGLNWCIASQAHQYLIIHAAVVEKDGVTVLLPAPPGSGKSTLCAGLVSRGWRLLSDEMALYDSDQNMVFGMARPVSLKGQSVEVIRRFAPCARLGDAVNTVAKGKVALMSAPSESVFRVDEGGLPAWIIFPQYVPGAVAELSRFSPAQTLVTLAEQSFNFDLHGVDGFEALCGIVAGARCARFSYSSLDEAISVFDDLAGSFVEYP